MAGSHLLTVNETLINEQLINKQNIYPKFHYYEQKCILFFDVYFRNDRCGTGPTP